MTTKRVTDERREKMSIRAARCYALHMETPDVSIDNVYPDLLHDYTTDVDDLLHDYATVEAENQRLRAKIAAMRPVVEAVAQAEAEPMQLYASEEDTVYVAELAASEGWEDEAISVRLPRDTYEQARAFVAAHPTAGVTFANTDGSDPDAYDEAESEGE